MEHLNLLRKIAWNFHKSSGENVDDLFQEAYLAYLYALKTYDPNKGYLSTHIWKHVSNQLITYLKKESQRVQILAPIEKGSSLSDPDHVPYFEVLTNDAHEIAKVVIASGKRFEFIRQEQGFNKVRLRLEHIMVGRGWSYRRFSQALYELRSVYQNSD